MKQPESKVKTDIVAQVKKAGGYARRIEDQFAVGILDTLIVLNGPDYPVFLAEVKILKNNIFGPSDRQYVEMLHVIRAQNGAAVAVLVGYDVPTKTFYITFPVKMVDIRDKSDKVKVGTNFIDTLKEFYNGL